MKRAPAVAVALTCSMLVGACSASGSRGPADRDPGAQEVEPRWTTIAAGEEALPDRPIRTIDAAASSAGDKPLVVAGTVAEPGGATRAAIWHPTAKGLGQPEFLDVSGVDGWPEALGDVADRTFVVGTSWRDGRASSFVQESSDRRQWSEVPLPASLADRDVYVDQVVDNGFGQPLALASSQSEVVAFTLEDGVLTALPSLGRATTSYGVSGAATIDGTAMVLVRTRDAQGKERVTTMLSTDGGRRWRAAGTLPGTAVGVSGVAATGNRLVATGSRLVDDVRRATAWSSTNGRRWIRESVPDQGVPGWDVTLAAPVARGGTIYTAVVDDARTSAVILRRGATGTWQPYGPWATDWSIPGTQPELALDGGDVVVARSEDGRLQVGRQHRDRRGWRFRTDEALTSRAPVASWSSVRADANRVTLVGARTEIDLKDPNGLSWERRTRLSAYALAGGRIDATRWQPQQAGDLSGLEAAVAPDGSEVLVGEQRIVDASGEPNLRLTGWYRPRGGSWTKVRGLGRPGTTYVRSVGFVGDEWVVTAVAADDGSGGPRRAAIWTSSDGRTWRRAQGPFDFGRTRDSWVAGACRLPDGDLLAVGGREDPAVSSRPIAFRRHEGVWRRLDLGGISGQTTTFNSCTTTGDATVVDGWMIDQAHWVTRDGKAFQPLAIGDQGDTVGPVIAVPGGFAATGGDHDRGHSQPVVWLSPDGRTWRPVSVPTESWSTAVKVVAWNGRLVVALHRASGPGAVILENLEDLLPPKP